MCSELGELLSQMGFHFQISDALLRVCPFSVNTAAVSLKLALVVEFSKCAEIPLTGCTGMDLLPWLLRQVQLDTSS